MLGRANPAIIPAVDDVARVSFAQMKYDQAADLIARELRIMEREYGDDDPKLVPSLEQVARVLEAASKYPDAEKFLARAIAIREKASGPESAELTPDLSQLARVNVAKHNWRGRKRCISVYSRSSRTSFLPIVRSCCRHWTRSPRWPWSRTRDAEPLLKQTLSIREGNLGPNHVDVAKNLDKLAAIYTEQKRFAEAQKASERALVHLDERAETGQRGAGREV